MATTGTSLNVTFGVNWDFKEIALSPLELVSSSADTPWDTSDWDTSFWSDEITQQTGWNSAKGDGYAIGSRLSIQSSTATAEWYGQTYLIEPGGVL
jgi:hypothetical protein